jgi:predicted nucleic acid-binding protein
VIEPGLALVIDVSVALAWFYEDETSGYADEVRDYLPRIEVVVPAIWSLEIANGLVAGEHLARVSEAKSTRFLTLLEALPITIDDHSHPRALHEIIQLARTQRLSSYGAAYLEVALRRGLPLATLDPRLRAAARAVGVKLFGDA